MPPGGGVGSVGAVSMTAGREAHPVEGQQSEAGEPPLDPTHTAIGAWSGGAFMPFGERLSDERLCGLLRPGEGVQTVLTSDVYGAGEADRMVGRAIAGLSRASYCLVGAVGHDIYEGRREGRGGFQRFTDPRLRRPEGYADYLRMSVERSLERCGVDSFDLLLLHNPDRRGYESEHVWAGMQALREDGLTRLLGIAPGPDNGFILDQIRCYERFGELIDWAMLILNPFEPWPAEHALGAASAHDVRVITRVVDHGGVFWDDVRPGHRFLPGDHRSFRPRGWVDLANGRLERIRPIAERHGLTMLQLACAWNLAHEGVACVVPSIAQEAGEDARPVEEKRMELGRVPRVSPLSAEEVREIRAVGENRGSVPLKGASRQYSGRERADAWPMTDELEEVGRRWGIDPDRDLYCPTDLRDVRERGAPVGGSVQALDRRLFIALHGFTGVTDPAGLLAALQESGMEGVIYESLTDPRGVAVVLLQEDPEALAEQGRGLLAGGPFAALEPLPGQAMIGRTYGTGHEPGLEDWLLHAPRRKLAAPGSRWGVWYPLRRTGDFYRLPDAQRGRILAEHGKIGGVFAEAGFAEDIRLECFGIDPDDNEYVIGLLGPRLDTLSRLVRAMRSTEQTASYMDRLGPFVTGRRIAHTIRGGD